MQRKTTASNSLPDDWEALGRLMALRLAYYVKVYGIPKELVVGLDETPVKTTPNAELATRALRNSGDVAGVGKENKYQVTATPLISAAGLLAAAPLQVGCHRPIWPVPPPFLPTTSPLPPNKLSRTRRRPRPGSLECPRASTGRAPRRLPVRSRVFVLSKSVPKVNRSSVFWRS